jgi:hypothetical protein
MTDADYLGRFSSPSSATFTFLFNAAEVKANAVLDPDSQMKKLIIPRETSITVAGYVFGFYYPIEIRLMSSGGFQIVYDGSVKSPIESLTDSNVDWEMINLSGRDYIKMSVPCKQFTLTTAHSPVNLSTGLINRYPYNNKFYFARVYTGSNESGWTEMTTTHSEQVYDHKDPTAVLTVLDGVLEVSIPHIYYTSNQLGSQLRVDIYTTRGELELTLSNYPASQFGLNWTNADSPKNSEYVAPLTALSDFGVVSDSITTGGTNGITFSELRYRVVNSSDTDGIPITDDDLKIAMSDRGYTISKRLDGITDRAYQVTRELPEPEVELVSASIGTTTETIEVVTDELRDKHTVRDNGGRVTVEPDTLYDTSSGVLKMVDDDDRLTVQGLPPENLVSELNNRTLLYTPFHYVLDMEDDEFEVRPYYLTAPSVVNKRHVAENIHVEVQTTTSSLAVEQIPEGYRILATVPKANILESIDVSQLHVQLGFVPYRERKQAHLNGELVGQTEEELVYSFVIETDFDLDKKDRLSVKNFRLYESDIQTYYMDLETEFSLYFSISNYPILQSRRSDIDRRIGVTLLPRGVVGGLEESCTIKFGEALRYLRNDSRSIASALEYETYSSNVVDTYSETIYERDENGFIKFGTDGNGDVVVKVLHESGEPILDELNNPKIKHRIGDIKYDASHEPIVKGVRKMNRQFSIVLFDARYLFSDKRAISDYRKALPETIASYLRDDVADSASNLLERTELKFAPRKTLGNIAVTVRDGKVIEVPSAQKFTVDYYMTSKGYVDGELRQVILNSTGKTIAKGLRNDTVSVQNIVDSLKEMGGDEVVTVRVSGLGEDGNISVYTLVDSTSISTLASRLEVDADGTINLVDDVTVNFIKHKA